MADFLTLVKHHGPGGWGGICLRLSWGETPSGEDITKVLRHPDCQPIPPQVREYIAGLLTGSIKRARGRKPLSPKEKLKRRNFGEVLRRVVEQKRQAIIRECRAKGVKAKDPYHEALERVAERHKGKLTAGKIDHLIRLCKDDSDKSK